MRRLVERSRDSFELHFWQTMATSAGLALGWRQRIRPLQPFIVFLGAGLLTFFFGRLVGQLLLAFLD